MKGKVFLCIFVFAISVLISVIVTTKQNTDFPAYYRASKVIFDPCVDNTQIYSLDYTVNRYDIPEAWMNYRYSMLIAYIMSPLALLDYYTAKGVIVFLNIMAYLVSVSIILRLANVSGRMFWYPLMLSVLYLPFIDDIRLAQINSAMFLLVTLSVYAAVKNRPNICGFLLGIASLIKFFPIGVAMILGLKNWRIFAACVVTFGLALLLPGTKEWFSSFMYPPYKAIWYSPIYIYLGVYLFSVYAAIIAFTTAIIAFKHRHLDNPPLAALAIPGVFLCAPVVEPYHLVLLAFTYAFLVANIKKPWYVLSLILVSAGSIVEGEYFYYIYGIIVGLFILWSGLIAQYKHQWSSSCPFIK